MNIIICGAGKVGFSISKQLSAQGHSVTVVDQSSEDIKKINKQDGIMVICNLHSLEIAREYCDRLIGLSDGKIVFDGHPSSLTKELAEQLYDLENE